MNAAEQKLSDRGFVYLSQLNFHSVQNLAVITKTVKKEFATHNSSHQSVVSVATGVGRFNLWGLPKTAPKSNWVYEVSSGYAGNRCIRCATWVYMGDKLKCNCT